LTGRWFCLTINKRFHSLTEAVLGGFPIY